jgi:F-type H+-transporting ATPase subunit c
VKSKLLLTMLAMLVLASPMFAQTKDAAAASNIQWLWITAGFAMAIASAVCALAQAKGVAAACEGVARNPGAAKSIQLFLILGLAFPESLALFTFAVIFQKVML